MRLTVFFLIWAGAAVLRADCVSGGTRPATPEESGFELQAKTVLKNALAGTMPEGWAAKTQPPVKASDSYCTGDNHPIGMSYRVQYENAAKKQAAFAKITPATASNPSELKKITDEASIDTDVKISVGANSTFCGLNGDGVKKIDVPGAKITLRVTDANKITTTLVCMGDWQVTKTAPTTIEAISNLPASGARTSVKTVSVNIEADPDRADQLLKLIKLQELAAMIH